MRKAYWVWLAGTTVSLLGSQVLGFAVGWAAAGHGGGFAGLALTAIVVPRVVLLLAGGRLADRFGAWRVLIVADLAMVVVTLGFAAAVRTAGPEPYLLLGFALAAGVVDAFYLPGSGSMPRRLVPAEALARAMSGRQLAGQLTAFAGPALGGVVLATAGLAGAALLDSLTFALMAVVLAVLRPRGSAPQPARLARVRLGPALRRALALTAVAAGFLLPVSSLLVPLLARERGASARTAGLLVAAIAAGVAVVAILVLVRGALSRPEPAAGAGLTVAAVGVAGLALVAPRPAAVALAAAVVVGVGTGLFATHIGPLLLGGAPPTHLARVQAVVILAQSVPLVITTTLLGRFADRFGVTMSLMICTGALLIAGVGSWYRGSRRVPRQTHHLSETGSAVY